MTAMDRRQTHPSHIAWRLTASDEVMDHIFTSRLAKDVEKTEKILLDLGYRIELEPLTEELLDFFWEKYQAFLTQKPRGAIFPIRESIQKNMTEGKRYTMINLYNPKKEFVGGLIVSENPKTHRITTAYKVLPHTLPERKRFPESIAYVFTFRFYRFALEKGYQSISHGVDRNPYGFYSNIGLALFKIRSGERPVVATKNKITFSDIISYRSEEDILIWLGDTPETPITKAILITKLPFEEAKEKYKPLFLLDGVAIEMWDHETYIKSLLKE